MHDRTQLLCQNLLRAAAQRYDLVLVPGRFNSGAEHWQSIWEQNLPIWQRVTQRNWNDPDTHRLNGSLRRLLVGCKRPALLVGHSLGALSSVCLALELPQKVAGVMLVAPAEPAKFHAEDNVPGTALGVPGLLVASHINVDSGFGPWHYGLELLCQLVASVDAAGKR